MYLAIVQISPVSVECLSALAGPFSTWLSWRIVQRLVLTVLPFRHFFVDRTVSSIKEPWWKTKPAMNN